mmetsp:Transcript_68900/g.118287  ORF Transcript_68900/g.118287 Transcript_68900/m.118287 type:complete len:207 (-) Transcript_68900:448-1068(-)
MFKARLFRFQTKIIPFPASDSSTSLQSLSGNFAASIRGPSAAIWNATTLPRATLLYLLFWLFLLLGLTMKFAWMSASWLLQRLSPDRSGPATTSVASFVTSFDSSFSRPQSGPSGSHRAQHTSAFMLAASFVALIPSDSVSSLRMRSTNRPHCRSSSAETAPPSPASDLTTERSSTSTVTGLALLHLQLISPSSSLPRPFSCSCIF